jgi:two-component system nitrate/nitrite sensor histidine kinase NarX
LAPALHNIYLVSYRRSHTVRQERARLARQLHDGPIQSLIGAEMQVDALCRRADADSRVRLPAIELRNVQAILRQEVLGLRELMVRMKPLDVTPEELPAYLSQVVNRFSRDSGIRGSFVAEGPPAGPARQHCVELARLVQEALSNVRKHSGATRVSVSLRTRDDGVSLVVEDNGRGFAFEGSMTITKDSPTSSAPEVLRESVESLGGQLVIDSKPGRGARLEITIRTASAPGATTPITERAAS